jgi:hypothetical protein
MSKSGEIVWTFVIVFGGSAAMTARAADDPGKDAAKVPELNRKIVQFCKDNLGKKVDNGECAMLVLRAFEAAGAKFGKDLPAPQPPMQKDDYVWGRQLGADEEVLPGDVIQFRDVEIKTVFPNRSWKVSFYSHHTAVVSEVKGKQKFIVIQQNAGDPKKTEEQRKIVQQDTLDLSGKTKGTIWIYRPLEE